MPTPHSPMTPVLETVPLVGTVPWRRILAVVVLGVGLGLAGRTTVRAQATGDSLSLAERYRTARVRALVQQYLEEHRGLPVQPPQRLSVGTDTLLATKDSADSTGAEEEPAPNVRITSVRRVRDLERSWFRDRYREVEWSFFGTGTRLTFVDTIRTRDLRARLEARFGEPTRTLAEIYTNEWVRAPDSTREEPIQFEYWFVVNDSIPVRVSDVNGPGERGAIVAVDRRYRADLVVLRTALLRPLRREERAPYVDYYYQPEPRRWYRVGFDGRTFFRERISRFDIVPGQRPELDSVRTDSAAARETDVRSAPGS